MKRKHRRLPLLYCYYCGCLTRNLHAGTNTCGCVVLMRVAYRHDVNFNDRHTATRNRAALQYQPPDINSK